MFTSQSSLERNEHPWSLEEKCAVNSMREMRTEGIDAGTGKKRVRKSYLLMKKKLFINAICRLNGTED